MEDEVREEQREAFEKWNFADGRKARKFRDGSYVNRIDDAKWEAWVAASEKAEERVKELEERKGRLLLLMVDGFYAGRKDEWQEGESYSEWEERCHDVLCDAGLDPYTNGGPEAIAKLRAALSKEESNA